MSLHFLWNGICRGFIWSADSKPKISVKYLVAEILNVKIQKISNSGNNFPSIFFLFCKPSWNMAAIHICINVWQKFKERDELWCTGGIWNRNSTLEELKNYACIRLIFMCIIRGLSKKKTITMQMELAKRTHNF